MTASGVRGIDLFKIAGRSISGWIPSLKTGNPHHVRQPFCSQLEERLLMYLEYHPQVTWYARGDINAHFAATYRLPTPKDAPFAIGYIFEGKPHHYLPDVVGTLTNGKLFIAEAGLEDEKREARQQAKAKAARKLARRLGGVYWLATEQTLLIQKHYNFVSLHARRQSFPDFAAIETALHEVWPWGEMASVEEVVPRLGDSWSASQAEAAIWKILADAAACGHLLVDLAEKHLDQKLPLALLPPDALPIVPDALPDTLPSIPVEVPPPAPPSPSTVIPGPPFDASSLEDTKRERYLRNLLAGAQISLTAKSLQMASSTLSRLVQRTRELGAIACVPYGSRTRKVAFHPAFQECIRRLYLLPTRLTIAAIHEHTEMRALAKHLSEETGETIALPSYDQVRKEVHRLKCQPELVAMREGAKALPRERQSPNSFALSVPAPALLTQVDEHSMELYVVIPDRITVTSRVHAAVLVRVKTASILAAVLALGPLKEEDYMRLVKMALEPKDRLVLQAGCQHPWPCYGKPAIVFHDRGKIFTSERARAVLVDRLQIITEQAPPYCPSAKGTVESLFRWMTQRFERRLPNTSYGVHDAETAAQAGGMTMEELERCFYQAIVDDYQQDWDKLRRQKRSVLWEHAVAQSGVPRYLGAPDDLKPFLMKAVDHKTSGHRYRVQSGSRLSFHGRWYVSPGLLNRLSGREFEVYYDRRDISVLYLFVANSYVGEAYCTEFMGGRVSEWEAAAMRKSDNVQKNEAAEQGREARARTQEEAKSSRKHRSAQIRASEKSREYDRQREEIHPTPVLERLASLAPKPAPSLKLPPAVPNAEPDRPVRTLPVRRLGGTLTMTQRPLPISWKDVFLDYVDKLAIYLHNRCYVAHISSRKCLHNSETAFEKRFQALLRSAWQKRTWHVIVADPGSGKTTGIIDLVHTTGSPSGTLSGQRYPILAVTCPKEDENEQTLGNYLYRALGLPIKGHWIDRKCRLMGLLVQYGVQCLVFDDAHDISIPHLTFIKELTDQGCLPPYNHRLGVCLVTAGRGNVMPLKDTLDQPETLWIQFRHRLDKQQPFCRIAGHTRVEVEEILATLETVCHETFPQLNLRQWGDSIYGGLTHPLLDPTDSGRVVMDHLMKLVSNALEWSYEAGEQDVSAEMLEKAAELLTLGRNAIRLIDGAGN